MIKKKHVRKFEFDSQFDGTYIVRIQRRWRSVVDGRVHTGGNVYYNISPEQLMVIRSAVAKIEAPVTSVRHSQFYSVEV